MNEIFTIGYAPHTLDSFIKVLKMHSINAIADVRSSPYSQYQPDFNREPLSQTLKNEGIFYVFMGKELGARVDAPECYINGKVDFKLVAQSDLFKEGIARLKKGMEKFRITLMCAEKDPLNCHRTQLVCRHLQSDNNIKIRHILFNGSIEEQYDSEKRLLKLHKLDHPDMFITQDDRITEAYEIQSQKIAYEEKNHGLNNGDK